MGQRSRKRRARRRGNGRAAPAAANMERGYARSRERADAVRASLEPLAPGELPTAVKVAAVVAALIGLGNIVLVAVDAEVVESQKLAGGLIFGVIMLVAAVFMWRGKYWAVLGFQALLGLSVITASLVAAVAGNVEAVVRSVVVIAACGHFVLVPNPGHGAAADARAHALGSSAMPDSSYDCIVIGSGPGGYVAAIRAAQLGMKTAVIERDVVGGRCLNYACIPAKAVLRVADVLAEIDEADEFGISVPERTVDFGKVMERRQKVIKTLTGGVAGLFKKNKIDYIEGHGSVTDDGNVKVGGNFDGTEIEAKTVILATGSVPKPLPGTEFGGRIIGTEEAWALESLPETMVVAGAGASGVEIASAYGAPRHQGDAVRGARPRRCRRGRRHLEARRPRPGQAEHRHPHRHARSRTSRPATTRSPSPTATRRPRPTGS